VTWDALPYAQTMKGEFAMQIVDGQIHLWGTGLPSVLAHWQVTHFTSEEAIVLMDEAGVDAAVISPPPWDPRSTELALGAVKNYPGRFAIMGSVPFDPPKSRGRIASWRDQPGMLGLRFGFIGDREHQRVQDGSLEWLWTAR
jgi:predicted TIM-barrel fold metal-dependent hydrolase